jgi:peptide/nickel transport system ATP-binding protein
MHQLFEVKCDIFAAPQHAYTKALFDAAPGRNFEFARVA